MPPGTHDDVATILGRGQSGTIRGLHHTALLSSDVEQTIRFNRGVLDSR